MSNAISDIWDGIQEFGQAFLDTASGLVTDILGIEEPDLSQFEGTLQTQQGGVAFIPTVYGTRKVGGTLIFMGSSGTANEYLWAVYTVCESPSVTAIKAIKEIYLNEELSTDAKFANQVTTYIADGTQTTNPFPELTAACPEWESTSILVDTAAVCMRYKWDQENGQLKAIPKIGFLVEGVKTVNVNTGILGYSENPIHIIFDYLTNKVYGKGLSPLLTSANPDLDVASFKAAAAYADEPIVLNDASSTTGPRFKLGMVANSGGSILENLKLMLQVCRGGLAFKNGRYYMFINKHYIPADYGLSQTYINLYGENYFNFSQDIILGGWKLDYGDISKRFNRVKVTYPNEDKAYASDYVVVEDSVLRAIDDNGELLEKQLSMPSVTDFSRAIRLAKVFLKRSRKQAGVSFLASYEAMVVNVGDIVTVTHPTPAWVDKQFTVEKLKIMGGGTVSVTLVEYDANFYVDEVPPAQLTVPDTKFTDISYVPSITGASGSSTDADLLVLSDGTIVTRIRVTWTPVINAFVSGYEVAYKLTSDPEYLPLPFVNSVNSSLVFITGVVDGLTYDIRVRAVNSSGYKGAVFNLTHTVVGKLTPPSDVSNLSILSREDNYLLQWDAVTNKDLSHYEVALGATYATSSTLATVKATNFLTQKAPIGEAVYWVVAVDTTGNKSSIPSSVTKPLNLITVNTLTTKVEGKGIRVNWDSSLGSFKLDYYSIQLVHPINGLTTLGQVYDKSFLVTPSWTGSAEIQVSAIDKVGNIGASASIFQSISLPSAPVMDSASLVSGVFRISWSAGTSLFPVAYYSLRISHALGDMVLGNSLTTTYDLSVDWEGVTTFYLSAWDYFGNQSQEAFVDLTIASPATPLVSVTTEGGNFKLSWQDCKSSLQIDKYVIKYRDDLLTDFSSAILITETNSISVLVPARAFTQRNYLVMAYDVAGNPSVVGVKDFTPSPPAKVTLSKSDLVEGVLYLEWANAATDFPIIEYIVKRGPTYNTALLLDSVKSLGVTVSADWDGIETFWVAAVDTPRDYLNSFTNSLDNYGVPTSSAVNTSGDFSVTGISHSFSEGLVTISWSAPSSILPIVGYVIEKDVNGSKVLQEEGSFSTYSEIPDWSGAQIFYVTAINSAGAKSLPTTYTVAVSAPSAPVLATPIIVGDRVEFSWGIPSGDLPVISYDIRYDSGSGTFAQATPIIVTSTLGFSRKVSWSGTRRFWVAAIDSSGNYGAGSTASSVVLPPAQTSILPQTIDNNVLLKWGDSTATLPIVEYQIKKGEIYSSAEIIGNISSLFFTIFETKSGTYKYWVTAVDSAGNLGPNNSVSAVVSEPPDYVLYSSLEDDFSGVKTNAVIDTSGNLTLPVNSTETYSQHFTANAYTNPQDQVNAGLPIYIQPTPSTASYEYVTDYGQNLNNLSVTCSVTSNSLAGNITFSAVSSSRWQLVISTSLDGTTYTNYPVNLVKVYVGTFRYVKVRVDVITDSQDDLMEISGINLTIDIKEKNDAGRGSVTTASTGSVVSFNKPFLDITGITVTPSFDIVNNAGAVSPVYAIYDFEDNPSPTNFTVYLYDNTGTKITGDFTWAARGR